MDVKATLDEAMLLEQNGSVSKALDVYQSVLEHAPRNYHALMGAGRSASNLGDIAVGIEHFRNAAEVRPDQPQPIWHIGVQQAKFDLEAAAKTYANGASKFPDYAPLKNRQEVTQIELNGDEFLSDFNIEAELQSRRHPEPVFMQVLNMLVGTRSDDEIARYYGRVADVFQSKSSKRRYAHALMQCRQFEKALSVLDDLPGDTAPQVTIAKAICKGSLGQFEEAKFFLESYMAGDTSAHSILRTCTIFMDAAPDLSMASKVIADLNRKYADPGLDNLLQYCAAILPPKRDLLPRKGNEVDHNSSEPGASGAAVLAFGGFGLRTGAMPFSLIDRFFAGHDVAVGTFVDRQHCMFWKGIAAIGETREATVSELKSYLDAANIDKVYTLGNSAGGVGAIVYGCELNARRALSFSGPTDTRRSFLKENNDTRAHAVIYALNKRLDDTQLNLRHWLEERPSRCPIHAYYCELEKHDKLLAENISHIPDVSLFPVERYAEHESIGSALGTGQLLTEFNSILDDISS